MAVMADADLPSASDALLIQKVAARDEAALGVLYHRYYPRLYRFVSRMTGYRGGVEEVINDTLYVVWSRAGDFRSDGKVSTWIFGIAYNKALKIHERARRHEEARVSEDAMMHEPDSGPDPGMCMQHEETGLWLSAALARLPASHRMTVELSYHYGMSYNEIAEIMRCSVNTAKTRMFHARKKLREILPQLAEHPGLDGD